MSGVKKKEKPSLYDQLKKWMSPACTISRRHCFLNCTCIERKRYPLKQKETFWHLDSLMETGILSESQPFRDLFRRIRFETLRLVFPAENPESANRMGFMCSEIIFGRNRFRLRVAWTELLAASCINFWNSFCESLYCNIIILYDSYRISLLMWYIFLCKDATLRAIARSPECS